MMEPTKIDDGGGGLDRRSVLRRGAVLGGALVWTVPAVQTIAGPAFATGSPRCETSFTGRLNRQCVTFTYVPTEQCCSCIGGSAEPLPFAIYDCAKAGLCTQAGPPTADC
jgi:hypothetical protein